MRIYVACLASYNAGTLHGRWIDATQGIEGIREEVAEMLRESPEPGAEEYAIYDFEGFGSWKIHEYESLETVATVAEAAKESEEPEAFLMWPSDDSTREGKDAADMVNAFRDAYCGEYKSAEDFAEEMLDETFFYEIPEHARDTVRSYFDYEAFARDLFLDDYWSAQAPSGNVYVFRRS